MSILIRDVQEHELDSVLALNNAAGPGILPMDAARIRFFFDHADYFRVGEVDGHLAGFLIALFIPLKQRNGASPLKRLEHELHPGLAVQRRQAVPAPQRPLRQGVRHPAGRRDGRL